MANEKNKLRSLNSKKGTIDIPDIGIGMLGYGLMGKAHSNGYLQMPYIFWPPPAMPRLIKLGGRNEEKVAEVAKCHGYTDYCTNWQDIINDDRVDIFVNTFPNNGHAEPCIEAAKKGKHVVCEKPLARDAKEAKEMLDAVNKAGIKHICNFNLRTVPSLVLAKKLVMEGRLGRIYHFRANYLMDHLIDPETPLAWRNRKEIAGSGVLGDVSVHVIDLARWLCGEIKDVMGVNKTFIKERPLPEDLSKKGIVDTDDASISILEFENGAIGYVESSGFSNGHRTTITVEINGELGSIKWDFEQMNFLNVYFKKSDQKSTRGFRVVNVTETYHPYYDKWSQYCGELIGVLATFVHTAYHIVDAVMKGIELSPMVATFEDGYRAAVVCDSILKSAESGKKVRVNY